MDLALEKMSTITKKIWKILGIVRRWRNTFEKKFIPKLKFWGVTELLPLNRISSRDSQSPRVSRKNRAKVS